MSKRLMRISIVLLVIWIAASPIAAEKSLPLVFGYQLRTDSVDDSVAVLFAVSATNVGSASVEVCGAFYFDCVFKPIPDIQGRERRCPFFGVLDGKIGPSLRCESGIILPGQTFSDTLRFKYCPGYFKPCTGQIEMNAELVYGESGTALNDAKRAGKDRLRVCIPIE